MRSCAPVNNRILEFLLLLLLQEILPDNDAGALAESHSGRSLEFTVSSSPRGEMICCVCGFSEE